MSGRKGIRAHILVAGLACSLLCGAWFVTRTAFASQPEAPPPDGGRARKIVPDGEYARQYQLPTGKLEALLKLMVREDVPVKVRRLPGAIEVIAPADQHATFEAFVRLLERDQQTITRRYHLPLGKLDDLTSLLEREDVPILVRRLPRAIEVQGTPAEHAVVQRFIQLIHPGIRPLRDGEEPPDDERDRNNL